MAKILRVHELAKELGLSNQATLDICNDLGIGVKTQSSSIIDQQATRVRRRVHLDAITLSAQSPAAKNGIEDENTSGGVMTFTFTEPGKPLNLPNRPIVEVKFEPSELRSVVVHEEFLEWFTDTSTNPIFSKKARFQIRNLLTRGFHPGDKSVMGAGKGWMRSSLGGRGGFQYYLWYVGHGGAIGDELGLGPGQFAVRKVRHHDETHLALDAGLLARDYELFTANDVEGSGDELVYTENQRKVAISNVSPIQVLKGYPGSGKTTALWLSASHAAGQRILYLTYSDKLAREAQQNFEMFRQVGTEVDVMTFPELIHHLADDRDDTSRGITPVEAARRLKAYMPLFRNRMEGWKENIDELYAELHAHGVGRAMPIDFLTLAATSESCLSSNDFVKLRSNELGEGMAISAGKILDHLRKNNHIDELFPGPSRSRRLLQDVFEPPTERLRGVSTVLVDEVQDLTQVETLLLLNVVARIGTDSGVMPRLVLAGDESQTVRPTDFRWSWLKNLVTAVFSSSIEIEDTALEQNLRSPYQIAKFVEATRAQYALFNKEDRPAGMSYTECNESLMGRLVYCCTKNEKEWARVVEIFNRIPRSSLIYPGFTIPDELTMGGSDLAKLATAAEIKGMDFDTVGLVDAGMRQEDLEVLMSSRELNPFVDVFGRTLADQYRVAASRASEKLILIDRNGNDRFDAILKLCRQRNEIDVDLERVSIGELVQILEEDTDQESLIRAMIDDVKRIIDDQPHRAILNVRSIKKQFEILMRSAPVPPELTYEVNRISGVVALVGLLTDTESETVSRRALEKEARSCLGQVDLGEAFEAVIQLATTKADNWSSERNLEALVKGGEKLTEVERDLPEVFRLHEKKLLKWMDSLEGSELPQDMNRAMRALTAGEQLAGFLSGHKYLPNLLQKMSLDWADQAIATNKAADALKILERLSERDHIREARCHVALVQHGKASASFEAGGDIEKAIEEARNVPDVERALLLAQQADSSQLNTLRWLDEARELFESKSLRGAESLSKAESELLLDWAKKAK